MSGDVEAESQIKRCRPRVFVFDKQVDGIRVLHQPSTDFSKTPLSESLTSFFGTYVDAFNVTGFRRAGDDVQLEDQPAVLNQNPHAILVDTTQVALSKSDRIFSQRIDAARFEHHRCLRADNKLEIFGNGET